MKKVTRNKNLIHSCSLSARNLVNWQLRLNRLITKTTQRKRYQAGKKMARYLIQINRQAVARTRSGKGCSQSPCQPNRLNWRRRLRLVNEGVRMAERKSSSLILSLTSLLNRISRRLCRLCQSSIQRMVASNHRMSTFIPHPHQIRRCLIPQCGRKAILFREMNFNSMKEIFCLKIRKLKEDSTEFWHLSNELKSPRIERRVGLFLYEN